MWNPDLSKTSQPKYRAIAEALEADIRSGRLRPGDRLPPQRELADLIAVNVSTVTRAYQEAERRGLISGTVGRGTYVAADARITREMMGAGTRERQTIEMGIVSPLYNQDPDLAERFARLGEEPGLERYLRYTDPAGIPGHRATGAEWVKRYGIEVDPAQVVITAGAQHGIACALSACVQPGDRIAVDALTYPGIKTLAAMLHIHLVPVKMDQEGMIPEAFAAVCRRQPVRGVYLMPAVQNPTGVGMGHARRNEIAAIIDRYELLLIEDDAYWHTAQAPLPALSAMVPERSIFIAGLSKMLFAGLRTAFVVVPSALLARFTSAVLNTLWMAPTLSSALVCASIEDGTVDRVIRNKLAEAKARNLLAGGMLPTTMPAAGNRSFFLWYPLPAPWTGSLFEEAARQRGVNVFCAEKFGVGNPEVAPAVRISLTAAETRDELAEGLRRLRAIVDDGYWPTGGVG